MKKIRVLFIMLYLILASILSVAVAMAFGVVRIEWVGVAHDSITYNGSIFYIGDYSIDINRATMNYISSSYNDSLEHSFCFSTTSRFDDNAKRIVLAFGDVSSTVAGSSWTVTNNCAGYDVHVHNHPSGICRASDGDMSAYSYMINQGRKVFIIQCNAHEILFYTASTFDNPVKVRI